MKPLAMMHRHVFEALNRSLCDVMKNDTLFGGKIIIFGGDFRQILPVIIRGNRGQIVNATLKRSFLWKHIRVMKLSTNVRVQKLSGEDAHCQQLFANYLLRIGEGTEPTVQRDISGEKPMVRIPDEIFISLDFDSFLSQVYPNLEGNVTNIEYLSERAILTTKNVYVAQLNDEILGKLPGRFHEFLSVDSIVDPTDMMLPTEFLNSLTISGIPAHKLRLKVDTPIMLMRNLRPADGLCNGTRLMCRQFYRYSI